MGPAYRFFIIDQKEKIDHFYFDGDGSGEISGHGRSIRLYYLLYEVYLTSNKNVSVNFCYSWCLQERKNKNF